MTRTPIAEAPAAAPRTAPSTAAPRARRNLQLDVLRGVALLLVIGRHLELQRPTGFVGVLAEAWFDIGWLGVDLFFVLSGFLIGGLLLTEAQNRGAIDAPRFLIRRGLKLYPPYLAFIAYLIAAPALGALLRGGDAWGTATAEVGRYWPNLVFLQNYLGSPAGHTWTLGVEEHFYLALTLALVVLVRAGRVRWVLRLALIAAPLCLALRVLASATGDPAGVAMTGTHLRLDALLFGVALRAAAMYLPERFAAHAGGAFLSSSAGSSCGRPTWWSRPASAAIRTVGLTATYLGAAAFLLAAYHTHAADFGRWAPHARKTATLVAWVGTYSYTIYLWHVTVLGSSGRVLGGWLGGRSRTSVGCSGYPPHSS